MRKACFEIQSVLRKCTIRFEAPTIFVEFNSWYLLNNLIIEYEHKKINYICSLKKN